MQSLSKPFQCMLCLPFGHIHKFKGSCIFYSLCSPENLDGVTLFCYDGQLIHAFLEIMMNSCSDTRNKNSSKLLFCLMHLTGFHGTRPTLVGKKDAFPEAGCTSLTPLLGPISCGASEFFLRI